MPRLRPILIAMAGALAVPAAVGQEVIARHTLTIEGIEEIPKTYHVEAIGLTTEVIVVDDGTPILKKNPGTATADGVTFFLPEVGDEVLVFFNWWTRIATTGTPESYRADIVGYNADGDPVARFYLENAWPSKVAISPLRAGGETGFGEIGDLRFAITLQADRIDVLPVEGTAPWPDIVDLSTDPRANTFTMSWRSVAAATYKVFRWDKRSGTFVEAAEVTADGPQASYTQPILNEDIFHVLLTSGPPPPVPPE